MYGTQTLERRSGAFPVFENDVKMYGTQTENIQDIPPVVFENDVKMYGTQTIWALKAIGMGLRMM